MPPPILAPVAIQQFFDANGLPLAGGQLSFFLAGTSTPSPAYADPALSIPLTNPVILDSGGRVSTALAGGPSELWLDSAISYKEVLQTAGGVTIWTADNVGGGASLVEGFNVPNTGTLNNYPLDGTKRLHVLSFTNAADLTLSGFAMTTAPQTGDRVVLIASNVGNVFLLHASAASQYKFSNVATSAPTPIAGGTRGRAEYIYIGGQWVLYAHHQGGMIQPPLVAANFFTGAGGTWTVPGSAIVSYWLQGTMLTVNIYVSGTTVAGTPGAALYIGNGQWGGFTNAAAFPVIMPARYWDNGVVGNGDVNVGVYATTQIAFRTATLSNWQVAAGSTNVFALLTFPVA